MSSIISIDVFVCGTKQLWSFIIVNFNIRNSITRFIWQQESWSPLPPPPHHWSQWGPHPRAPPSRPSWTSPSLSSLPSLNLPRTLRKEDLMFVLMVGNLHFISMISFWISNFFGTFSLEILGTATSCDRLLPPSCHGCLHCIVDLEKYLPIDTTCLGQKHHNPNNAALFRDLRQEVLWKITFSSTSLLALSYCGSLKVCLSLLWSCPWKHGLTQVKMSGWLEKKS